MELLSIQIILCLVIVTIYMLLSVYLEEWKFEYLHESGVTIIVGGITGLVMHLVRPTQLGHPPGTFESTIFFNFMLPFLILSAGYNLKRRRFFRNISSIFLFGVLGTIICFVVIGIGAFYLSELGLIVNHEGETIYITIQDGMILGAVLSASDVVCALSLVKEEKTPRLHSILFGEAVVNDAIGILLFQTLQRVGLDNIDSTVVLSFVGRFFYNCFCSMLLGVVFGLIAGVGSKVFTKLRNDASNQTALLFYLAWIPYVLAEILGLSGVISMLVCSIIMGHYAWYNLTPQARGVTSDAFKFLGNGSEALVFAYLGITAVTYLTELSSLYFILAMVALVMAARLISTFGLVYLFQLLTCGKYKLPARAVAVVWVGGTIRGAVAFALIAGVTGEHHALLKSTILGLVILTTVGFGTLLPLWVKIVKPQETDAAVGTMQDGGMIMKKVKAGLNAHLLGYMLTKEDLYKERKFLHRKWREFDDKYLKPCLINPGEIERRNLMETQFKQEGDN